MINILLPASLFGWIDHHGRSWAPGVERGGLILGYRKAGALEVTSISFPSRWDRATPTAFFRSERGHRKRALREWVKSRGYVDWIGEWHTHPGGFAEPSFRDRSTWKDLVKHTGQPMVFIIVAGTSRFIGLQPSVNSGVVRLELTEEGYSAMLFRAATTSDVTRKYSGHRLSQ
jgi:integrative and conjugative element protein (TIGR02256 family)